MTWHDEILAKHSELVNKLTTSPSVSKAEFGKLGMTFNLATPTMVTGKGVEIHLRTDIPIIVLPFKTDCGTFVLEANLSARN